VKVSKDIEIEDLVRNYPSSVTFLREKGIRCLRCGEPIWGTLEEAAREKNFNDDKIKKIVEELTTFLDQK
jgi:iron-sulfur cluster repair protein YtfE (RIC family)